MPTALHLNILGSVLAVPTDGATRERLAAQWSRCLADDAETPVAQVDPVENADEDRHDYALASALTRAGIAQQAGRTLMLHACGVSDLETGRVAVLVAPSGTGKTTAAHRLCATRFGYVSDETIAIDESRTIEPYPKPLSVVLDPQDPYHKSQHSPDELTLQQTPRHPVASLLVLLERDDGRAGEPWCETVPLLDAMLALIPHTSALPALDEPLLVLARHITAMGGVMRLHYRDIEDCADLLQCALDRSAPLEADWSHLPPGASDRPMPYADLPDYRTDVPVGSASVVERAPYTDAVATEDEVLVLVGQAPLRLTGLGATIWVSSSRPASTSTLVETCIAEHGDHPQARELVEQAVGALLGHGVLRPAGSS